MRLVVDISGSMAVADGGQTRMDLARRAADAALADIRTSPGGPICADIATVSAAVQVYPDAQADGVIAGLAPLPEGSGIASLFAGFTAPSQTCGTSPTHVVVITDQPPQPLPADAFGGHVIWHQVGAPQDNLAIADIALRAGTLRDVAPEITLQVASFGAAPTSVSAIVDGPAGRGQVALRRDAARDGGWIVSLPFTGAGDYQIALTDGGSLTLDDRVRFSLGALDRLAVDWQLPDVPRPVVFAKPNEDATALVIAPYAGPNAPLPDGPFVLTYQGWPGAPGAQIGPFMRDHPVLEGLNFDVFESAAPGPRQIGQSQALNSVIRPNGLDGTWVAVRDTPRGVIVPQPTNGGGPNVAAMSKLMFFNAIFWVAQDAAPAAPAFIYETAEGLAVPDARGESLTSRALAPAPCYALLREPPLSVATGGRADDTQSWVPWLIVMALFVLLVERSFGLDWTGRRSGDV